MRALVFAATVFVQVVSSHGFEPAVVYFTSFATVYRVPATGGRPEQLLPEVIHGGRPGIAIDSARRHVYWTGYDSFGSGAWILRRSLEGGPDQLVVSNWGYEVRFGGIDVDEQDGRIYWSNERDGAILRANLDGSDTQTVASGAGSNLFGIAVIPSMGYVYWTTHGPEAGSGKIRRAPLAGGIPEEVLVGLDQPRALALSADGELFWTETTLGHICRTDLQSPATVTVLDGLDSPKGLGFDAVSGRMYWGEGGSMGNLRSATPLGSEVTTVVSNWPVPYAIDIATGRIAVHQTTWGELKQHFR